MQKYIQLHTCIQNYILQKAIEGVLEYIMVIIHYAKPIQVEITCHYVLLDLN